MFTKIQDGGRRHLEFRVTVAIPLLVDQSAQNLVGMLRICHRMQLLYQKCTFTEIQDGRCHHLDFRKSVAICFTIRTNPHQIW